MIVIDWKSPPTHRNFNRAFLLSCKDLIEEFYTFDKDLDQENKFVRHKKILGRFSRFLYIRNILKENRGKKVFFLTYDPFFIIFLRGIFLTYEHNSVPENILSRHGIFQLFFYRKLIRFCQNKQQVHQVERLNGSAFLIGCPLEKKQKQLEIAKKKSIFIGSQRCWSKDLIYLKQFFPEHVFLFKKGTFIDEHLIDKHDSKIICKEWVSFEDIDSCSFISVLLENKIRPSGWFGESITRGIPLLIKSNNVIEMFSSTFPGVPFTHVSSENLKEENDFNYEEYINKNNLKFGKSIKQLTDNLIL